MDPVNLRHVRHTELANHLGRDRLVVLLLRVLDPLREGRETFGAKASDGFGDAVGDFLLDLVGKRGRGLTDDGDRVGFDVVPVAPCASA